MDIRGRGDDGDSSRQLRRLFRQPIGSSQMAGQKGNGKAAAIIDDHNGRIRPLVLYPRCNGPDGDPCGPDENQPLPRLKLVPGPFLKAGF